MDLIKKVKRKHLIGMLINYIGLFIVVDSFIDILGYILISVGIMISLNIKETYTFKSSGTKLSGVIENTINRNKNI